MFVLHLISRALRGKGKEPGLQIGSSSPHLFSNQPSPSPWSTFPPVFPRYVSFIPPSSHQCISIPIWCLHVVMHLRAVCGIVLWAGIWQCLIRERMSCAIPSELIFFPIVLGKHWKVFFFFFFLKDLPQSKRIFFRKATRELNSCWSPSFSE